MAEEENGSTLPLQHLNELPTPRLFLHYLEDKITCTDVFCLIVGLSFSIIVLTMAT